MVIGPGQTRDKFDVVFSALMKSKAVIDYIKNDIGAGSVVSLC